MILEVNMQPFASRGTRLRSWRLLPTNADPLALRMFGNQRVDHECVADTVPRHVDEPDQVSVISCA